MLLTTAPIGDQFVVAETLAFTATPAAIAVNNDGSFSAAWESFEEEAGGSGFGVFAQRYDANGNPISARRQVNTEAAREQSAPAIAVDAHGNELVVWQSKGQDGDGFGIYGQWYDNSGAKKGPEFRVNSATVGDQKSPAVAIDGAGNAIVAWQSVEQDGSEWGVYYTKLDGVGDTIPMGDVLVNDATTGSQQNPAVAASSGGHFVIAWEAIDPVGGDDASLDIYAKVYNSAGSEITFGEQLVNSDQVRDQVSPQVAIDADGDFAIVWVGSGIPGSGSDVFGQRFNALAARQGQQFRANDTTLASQVGGVVSMDAAGNFIVSWQSVHQDGFSEGVFARAYNAAGNTLIDEFRVNTVTEGPQSAPSIGMNANGRTVVTWRSKNEEHESALWGQRYHLSNTNPFLLKVGGELELASFVELEGSRASAAMDPLGNSVVVYESYDQDDDGLGVFGQLLDRFGDPVGGPFLVNTGFTAGNQTAPAVARASNGSFVVAWQSIDQDLSGYGIYAQRYSAAGIPQGTAFQVNSTSIGNQVTPAVAMGDDGRFVIVWQGDNPVDGTTDIFAQRYNADGSASSGEFKVNQFEAKDQIMPTVTMNAVGQFAIAWVSSHPAAMIPEIDPEKSVFVQWYDASGLSNGPEVIAHNYVKDAQESPQIGMDAAGNFVLAWQSINQDGSTWGVYARQFRADKTPVQLAEFQVNQTTEGLQRLVGLGVDASGSFVVAFESTLPGTDDGISTEIYRREFFPDGRPNGGENVVNTWTGGPQTLPVVARAANGNYGIFWMGQGFSHIDGVHGRIYDTSLVDDPGTPSRIPIGNQFLVGQTVGFEFGSPALAVHEDGTFTIAFETFEEDTSGFGIFTERFDATGVAIANSRVQVNQSTVDDQSAPAIATDRDGNVLIVWQSKDTDGFGIFGQWLDNAGQRIGTEFPLNSTQRGNQTSPDVAIDETGQAIVAWQSEGQDGDGLGIFYTTLKIDERTPSSERRANVAFVGDQQMPRVAAAAIDQNPGNNQFVIGWQGPGPVEAGEEETEASIDVFARLLNSDGTPKNGEIVVNSILERDQVLPDLGMDANGNVVFVWQAEGQQGSGSDVFGRRMTAGGTLLGNDLRINTTISRPQRLPSVAVDENGNYLVAWQSQHQDGYSWGIYRQGFDSNGVSVGGEVVVNHRVEGPQTAPTVASNSAGDAAVSWLGNSATHQPSIFAHLFDLPATEVEGEILLTSYVGLEETPPTAAMNAARESVVAWTSYAEDGSGLGIFAQLLDKQGLPINSRFQVNQYTPGNQSAPTVARSANGPFVIAWQSEDQDGSGYGIYAQRYSADGQMDPNGPFLVNSTTSGDQKAPTVAMDDNGNFVISWESVSADGSLDIMARRYSASGVALGTEFRVNNQSALDQYDPAIAMNADGKFVVAWVSNHPAAVLGTEDTEKSIFVQSFNSSGQAAPLDEVLVHRYVKDAQEAPSVGIDAMGRFVVAWQSINQDGNSWGVFARRFEANKTPIDRREFVVNETRLGPQRYVGLGTDPYGRFVVAWQSNTRAELADGGSGGGGGGGEPGTPEGSSWELFARQYSWDGSPEGGELSVNTWQMGPQILPVVAQAPGGDFGIFWLGQGPDHVEGVHGRLYQGLFDFGDAPDPLSTTAGQYPTRLASNGARHLPGSSLYLGSKVDVEFDAQPTTNANGDDTNSNGDDEDGVVLPTLLFQGAVVTAQVTASIAGKLDAWIDYDRDGIFEAGEKIASSFGLISGSNAVTFVIPSGASPGLTYARFRVSSAGGLQPEDAALDGEVEDYSLEIYAQGTARLVDDPANPGMKILLTTGTSTNNNLLIKPRFGSSSQIQVINSGRILGNFNAGAVSRILVYGLSGNDIIRVDTRITKPAELHGNEGHDSIYGGSKDDMIFGGEGNDKLYGNSGDDTLWGGTGNDSLYGGSGNDKLYGEEGNDKLYGDNGDDTLWGGAGNDSLYGGSGNDKLYGQEGNDNLNGNDGSDLIVGGFDNDTLRGGRGRDFLIGSLGHDILYGDADEDILTGNSTTHDQNEQALLAILAEWRSFRSFTTRIASLKNSLDSLTIIDDGIRDNIFGGTSRDWMLDFALRDTFRDFNPRTTTGDRKN